MGERGPEDERNGLIAALLALAALVLLLLLAVPAVGCVSGDTLVSTGTGPGPFPVNKQDEPGVAVDPIDPTVMVAGVDDAIDNASTVSIDTRRCQAVMRHADVTDGTVGDWTTVDCGAIGDARASSANALTDESLGDYNWIVATNDFAAAVWNDARSATVDQAVLDFRSSLLTSSPLPKPAPTVPTFGNTGIYGMVIADPTP